MNGAMTVLTHDACEAAGLQIIATCWMGNHYHAVVYDPFARVSEWTAHVNDTLSRFCNATQRARGHMWDAQEDNDQELGDLETVAKTVAYVIANPVAAGLVHSPSAYPGICTTLDMVASDQGPTANRPKGIFRAGGPVSEIGEVAHHCPPGIAADGFRALVKAALDPLLAEARRAAKVSARGFRGAAAVKATDPFETAKRVETKNVGLKSKSLRRMLAATAARVRAMVARYLRFQADYTIARAKLVEGVPNNAVMFPVGTWRLWRYSGARRHAPSLTVVKVAAAPVRPARPRTVSKNTPNAKR
ncbi:MAG: putative transposase [Myxococcota bacterium]|jgi:putative transposase